MKLHYFYDKDADVLYFSKGKPSERDVSQETRDDVVLRLNPKTKQVRGFTILNATKRLTSSLQPIALPVEMILKAS